MLRSRVDYVCYDGYGNQVLDRLEWFIILVHIYSTFEKIVVVTFMFIMIIIIIITIIIG